MCCGMTACSTCWPHGDINWRFKCLGCYCMEHPMENHLKLKFCKILFAHNIHFNWPIIFKFCTEHGSFTAVLCAKFQNALVMRNKLWVNSISQEFETSFRVISYIATADWISILYGTLDTVPDVIITQFIGPSGGTTRYSWKTGSIPYHGCWCLGSLCHQAISRHGIDCVW